jgi:molecular chaperone DnaK (HSP70)
MPIPSRDTRTDFTHRDDQQRIIVEVFQVKSADEGSISLGHFAFPVEGGRKNRPIEVSFGDDAQGMVTVVARDPANGREFIANSIMRFRSPSGSNLKNAGRPNRILRLMNQAWPMSQWAIHDREPG